MNEPTVLDYLKSLFHKNRINIPAFFSETKEKIDRKNEVTPTQNNNEKAKYCLIVAVIFALIGQFLLEPPQKKIISPIAFYSIAIVFFWISLRSNNLVFEENISEIQKNNPKTEIKLKFFIPCIISLIFAFVFFANNQFTYSNLFFWVLGSTLFVISAWQINEKSAKPKKNQIIFYLIYFSVVLIAAFFRFFLIKQIPGEMFSDHAEKLLDIMDILDGHAPIFFVRNTGREALQFYFTAAIIKLFNTGISFISLKLGTTFLGFITLPFIYLSGKQLFNKWVGVLAFLFAGIAYWPNVISRVGLRFPLYPLFTAITFYFLIKGLQERKTNQLLLSGLFLGMGLHGYSPIRIVPILVAIVFFTFFIKEKTKESRIFAINGFILLSISAFIVFLPLFRYFLENPYNFNYRALSRLTSMDNPINDSVLLIFIKNLWNSLIMFFYKNGVVWVNSIPNRPALDVVSAVFFLYGLLTLLKRFIKSKSWSDLSLLISIPVLMMPSILSLAFPQENPALNRSSGAVVPVFIIVGVGVYSFMQVTFSNSRRIFPKYFGALIALLLFIWSAFQNYDLVFNKYSNQFLANAWNTSEMGNVIAQFVKQGNSPENAFVIPFPYWADTPLVGINAGYPRKDYALWPDDIKRTQEVKGNKLFILIPQDRNALDTLKLVYPQAEEEFFYSNVPGKNFIIVSAKT